MTAQPTIGRIVHYRLSKADEERLLELRTRVRMHQIGFNAAYVGDVYPAIVVRTTDDLRVNLQVWLDGPDTLWVTSRGYSVETDGCWFWPPRVDMTREGK